MNKDNLLRQRRIDHTTYTWAEGPLNALNIKVFDADRIGLTSCLYLGTIANVATSETKGHGTRLFVATTATTFNQYSWYPSMTQWSFEKSWTNLNGHASPACYGWGKGHTFYTWFVNLENSIDMYWYAHDIDFTSIEIYLTECLPQDQYRQQDGHENASDWSVVPM